MLVSRADAHADVDSDQQPPRAGSGNGSDHGRGQRLGRISTALRLETVTGLSTGC